MKQKYVADSLFIIDMKWIIIIKIYIDIDVECANGAYNLETWWGPP